jgi:hypothetical protein
MSNSTAEFTVSAEGGTLCLAFTGDWSNALTSDAKSPTPTDRLVDEIKSGLAAGQVASLVFDCSSLDRWNSSTVVLINALQALADWLARYRRAVKGAARRAGATCSRSWGRLRSMR